MGAFSNTFKFQPSLSYQLSLRSLFCLFLSGRRQSVFCDKEKSKANRDSSAEQSYMDLNCLQIIHCFTLFILGNL